MLKRYHPTNLDSNVLKGFNLLKGSWGKEPVKWSKGKTVKRKKIEKLEKCKKGFQAGVLQIEVENCQPTAKLV